MIIPSIFNLSTSDMLYRVVKCTHRRVFVMSVHFKQYSDERTPLYSLPSLWKKISLEPSKFSAPFWIYLLLPPASPEVKRTFAFLHSLITHIYVSLNESFISFAYFWTFLFGFFLNLTCEQMNFLFIEIESIICILLLLFFLTVVFWDSHLLMCSCSSWFFTA